MSDTQSGTLFKLVSRLKYAVQLKLKDTETAKNESIFIAPHGKIDSIDLDTVETQLPPGIQKVELQQ